MAVNPERHDTLCDDGICSRTPSVRLGDRFPRRPQSCAAEVDLTDGGDA